MALVGRRLEPLQQLAAELGEGATEAQIATEVTFEDGHKGVIAAHVTIRDMKPYPTRPANMERAA